MQGGSTRTSTQILATYIFFQTDIFCQFGFRGGHLQWSSAWKGAARGPGPRIWLQILSVKSTFLRGGTPAVVLRLEGGSTRTRTSAARNSCAAAAATERVSVCVRESVCERESHMCVQYRWWAQTSGHENVEQVDAERRRAEWDHAHEERCEERVEGVAGGVRHAEAACGGDEVTVRRHKFNKDSLSGGIKELRWRRGRAVQRLVAARWGGWGQARGQTCMRWR